jgi:hypothetical protein
VKKSPLDDDSLSIMLAAGRMSAGQRERVLERVLGAPQRRARAWLITGGAVSLAAAMIFLVIPLSSESDVANSAVATGLRPKGSHSPLASARCEGRPAGTCRVGDRMIFEVEGLAEPAFFGAYADCSSGDRVWYFPSTGGSLPSLVPAERVVVDQAVRVGPEHVAPSCAVHLFVLHQRANREALRSGNFDGTEAVQTIAVQP